MPTMECPSCGWPDQDDGGRCSVCGAVLGSAPTSPLPDGIPGRAHVYGHGHGSAAVFGGGAQEDATDRMRQLADEERKASEERARHEAEALRARQKAEKARQEARDARRLQIRFWVLQCAQTTVGRDMTDKELDVFFQRADTMWIVKHIERCGGPGARRVRDAARHVFERDERLDLGAWRAEIDREEKAAGNA